MNIRVPIGRLALWIVIAGLIARAAPLLAVDDPVETQIRKTDRSQAPDLDGAVAWINTDKPLKLADLKGKIVLLDFWTFG